MCVQSTKDRFSETRIIELCISQKQKITKSIIHVIMFVKALSRHLVRQLQKKFCCLKVQSVKSIQSLIDVAFGVKIEKETQYEDHNIHIKEFNRFDNSTCNSVIRALQKQSRGRKYESCRVDYLFCFCI